MDRFSSVEATGVMAPKLFVVIPCPTAMAGRTGQDIARIKGFLNFAMWLQAYVVRRYCHDDTVMCLFFLSAPRCLSRYLIFAYSRFFRSLAPFI